MENLPNRNRAAEVFNLPDVLAEGELQPLLSLGSSYPASEIQHSVQSHFFLSFSGNPELWKCCTGPKNTPRKNPRVKNEKVTEVDFWMGKISLKLA